jgi:hypothetical protein
MIQFILARGKGSTESRNREKVGRAYDSVFTRITADRPDRSNNGLLTRSQSYDFWIYSYNASVVVGRLERF